MSRWKKILVILLCTRLFGDWVWSQPTDPVLKYLTEGIEAYQRGEWQVCAGALDRALAQGFSNPRYKIDALVFLGRAYAKMEKEKLAEKYFEQVLDSYEDYRLDPGDPAGLAIFNRVVARRHGVVPPESPHGRLPIGKITMVIALTGVVVAAIWKIVIPRRPTGTIEGVIELP